MGVTVSNVENKLQTELGVFETGVPLILGHSVYVFVPH